MHIHEIPRLAQSVPHVPNLPINERWDENINELECRDSTLIIWEFSQREDACRQKQGQIVLVHTYNILSANLNSSNVFMVGNKSVVISMKGATQAHNEYTRDTPIWKWGV